MKNNPFFLGLLSLLPLLACADEPAVTAQQLINQMSRAVHELNYDGIFIYRNGQQMDTMRLIHKKDDKGEYERLISLTGYAREVIRNRESVTCIFPEDHAVMVEKSRPRKFLSTQLPESVGKIIGYYNFNITGTDRIAGRDAWTVNISPKDGYRYGYQFWIDRENYLLLKSELINNSGFPLEQILFTKLDVFETIPDEWLKPSISGKGYTWYNSSELTATEKRGDGGGNWRVSWMPEGFTMSQYNKQAMASSESPVDHMVYTDGLAMVSVFIEKLGDKAQFTPGASKMGAVNTYARQTDGYQVTAVGEVPQTTVQKMANSVMTLK